MAHHSPIDIITDRYTVNREYQSVAGQGHLLGKREKALLERVKTGLGAVEVMQARYVTQVFAPHFHEGYCLGVIEAGALGFRYMGENVVAPAGAVNLAVPGEVHTGQAADEAGWMYRMFYLDADLVASVASQMAGRKAPMPFIRPGVLFDAGLARMIHRLHRRMQDPRMPILEKEAGLLAVLTRLLGRYGRPRTTIPDAGREPGAVDTARDYMHACHDRDISIRELAAITGLSPYHFIRVFSGQVGLTPHAYLIQVRVHQARRRLLAGEAPAQAAVSVGFYDQSHLTRHFKRILGVTPGRYRNSVQDTAIKNAL
jgi:AraC-like DNA-binding protein